MRQAVELKLMPLQLRETLCTPQHLISLTHGKLPCCESNGAINTRTKEGRQVLLKICFLDSTLNEVLVHQLRLTGGERLQGSTATRTLSAAWTPPLPGQWAWCRSSDDLLWSLPHHTSDNAAYLIWRNLLTIYGGMVTPSNLLL